tara:strand:- start:95 stop:310 length:216 start_codon:yes stop_codon:yes gene_type:complete
MNELNEKEYTWMVGEIKKCIAVNNKIMDKGDPNDEELEDAYGRRVGLEYVLWLLEYKIYRPGNPREHLEEE